MVGWTTISAVEQRPVPGIKLWLRHWFSSLFVVLFFFIFNCMLPVWEIGYDSHWIWPIGLFGTFTDSTLNSYGESLLIYLFPFLLILIWNFFDIKNITLHSAHDSAFDAVLYRIGLASLVVICVLLTIIHISIFDYLEERPGYFYTHEIINKPIWPYIGILLSLLLLFVCIVHRAMRSFSQIKRRQSNSWISKRDPD